MIEFARPGFLWALPAAAMPLLIHLLNRRRFRRVSWAAMEHLARAERDARQRVRWQNLLLLLLRTGAVLLIVLLFAQPHVAQPLAGLSGKGAGRAPVVVLLDDSASMAQRVDDASAYEKAKEFCLSAAERLAVNGADLVAYAASRREPFFSASPMRQDDLARLKEQVERLQPTATAFRPRQRLTSVVADVAGRSEEVHFYIATDLRAADWGADQLDPGAHLGLEALQDYGTVCLVDVGAEPGANVGVTALDAVGRFRCARSVSAVRLTISNRGPTAFGPGWLRLQLDGRSLPPVAAPKVQAGESREVPLEVFLDDPGYHALAVELDTGDAFPPDDQRFLAIEALEEMPVLVVEGAGEPAPPKGPAYYLRAALRPGADGAGCIRPEALEAFAGPPADLAGYAAIFLCNVRDPRAWGDGLARYAEAGGRVIIFLGGDVDAAAWNASLLDEGAGLLPCRLEQRVELGAAEAVRLGTLDFSHPLLDPFSDWEALFAVPRFSGLLAARPLGATRVLARFDDPAASPAILCSRVGDGQVFLFTSSADDEWSDWPRSEVGRVSYVSLVQWLVQHGEGPSAPALNLTGGSAIEFPLDPSRFQAEATLAAPSAARAGVVALRAVPGGRERGLRFISDPLTHAGIWELQLRGLDGARNGAYVAVNPPDGERQLERTRSERLRDAALSAGRLQVMRYDERLLASLLGGPVRYWPGLVAAILVVLVTEGLLACVFSTGPRANLPGDVAGVSPPDTGGRT